MAEAAPGRPISVNEAGRRVGAPQTQLDGNRQAWAHGPAAGFNLITFARESRQPIMSRETYIPQFLDEPERFLVFTPDELVAVVAPLALCTVLLNFAVGLLLSAAAFVALRKMKQGGGLHRLLWILYWHAPGDVLRLKGSPPSHLRELAG